MSTTAIRTAIAAKLSGVSGVTYSPAYSPFVVPTVKLPGVFIEDAVRDESDYDTGSAQVSRRFALRVYMPGSNAAAATLLDGIIDGIYKAFRDDHTLGGVIADCSLSDEPAEVVALEGQQTTPLIMKTLTLSTVTYEA